jgi:hypothetical protein
MAPATEAPATTQAEGPTSHTQKQASLRLGRLSDTQIGFLLKGIDPNRVGEDGKGFSHVEAWDVRRHLIRVFGFGGFDTDLLEMQLVGERSEQRRKKNRKGEEYGDPYTAWTVVYRVAVRLTVKVDGVELGHWHGMATGDATNQPSLADAHDLALKTADSQALKRAATNLGDQFGLSLYNNGSFAPVVNASLAYLKPEEAPKLPEDPPVQPEPGASNASAEETDDATAAATPPAPDAQRIVLDSFKRRVVEGWNDLAAMEGSLATARSMSLLDEVVPTGPDNVPTRIEDLLNQRIAQLKQAAQGGNTGRNAA